MSHDSNVGPIAFMHCGAPPEHTSVPMLHSPAFVPHVPPGHCAFVVHAEPAIAPPKHVAHEPRLARPSSNMPSQSLSFASHSSGWPLTVPIAPMHWIAPFMQRFVPATHSPTSVPHLP